MMELSVLVVMECFHKYLHISKFVHNVKNFFKVFNGLIVRTARDNKLDVNERNESFPQADIRVGLIPAGSTDCVAMCLHGNNDPVTAALHIALGTGSTNILSRIYIN